MITSSEMRKPLTVLFFIGLIYIMTKYSLITNYLNLLKSVYSSPEYILLMIVGFIFVGGFAASISLDSAVEEPKLDPNQNLSELDKDWRNWIFYAHHANGHKYMYELREDDNYNRYFRETGHAPVCQKCLIKKNAPIRLDNGLSIDPNAFLPDTPENESRILGTFKDKDGNEISWGVVPPPRNERSKIQLEYLEGD